MRKIATFAAALMLGGSMAVLAGGTAAQAAARPTVQPARPTCWTTIPVTPRRLPWERPYRPSHQCPGWHTTVSAWTIRH